MQDRFAVKLLTAAKAMGVHTALDTNGYYGDRLTDEELEAIDLVLLDLKGWDPERHRRLTGMDIGPTLAFARRLAAPKAAGLGALRARARAGPTTRRRSKAWRASRHRLGQRRARRRPALPPDGPLQVGAARTDLPARTPPSRRRRTRSSRRAPSSGPRDCAPSERRPMPAPRLSAPDPVVPTFRSARDPGSADLQVGP